MGLRNRKWHGPDSPELMDMLVNVVPHLMTGGVLWEDHHLVHHLMDSLKCNKDFAELLLKSTMRRFPNLRVINTGLDLNLG